MIPPLSHVDTVWKSIGESVSTCGHKAFFNGLWLFWGEIGLEKGGWHSFLTRVFCPFLRVST